MLTPQKHPRGWAASAGGERRCQQLTRPGGEPSTAIYSFVDNWEDAARHFLSAFRADTYAGHAAAVDAGLCEADFPRRELWEVVEVLGLCALASIQQPSIGLILAAAEDTGRIIHGGNPYGLTWLVELEYCAARLLYWLAELRSCARRATLARALYRAALAEVEGDTKALEPPQPARIVTRLRHRARRAV